MIDRKLTGAHYGLRDWVMQRITAVLMLVYTVFLLAAIICLPNTYADWQSFFAQTWVRLVTQIAVIAVMLHAWVGVRDLWMDYIKPLGLRLFMHVATILWLVGCLVYSVKVIWGLA
ncbi:succinate dehydrogenase, hydrophobic membrane anchor protein [Snodgrassella sp. CFCC 13594]|jgi:succinate dehydrogenase / fumarate reductase membrane anchor subunit|uniref:succinate dehydrogenase, hydrophobic membrane anchor protein n=1 Tax=Snodgrassella sp. CFCC 13594 TaxID=1775559 RepID=UPI00082E0765|nr:succinate dehydrogenase, hydrophobic membrane anchor protein [Snodgrassella sp. CFCC 13594]